MRTGVITIFILFLFYFSILHGSTLRLGSSTLGGNYFELGKIIDSVVTLYSSDDRIQVINTEGSVDNILKLANNEIDLAIIQNDIAFLAENGLLPFNKSYDGMTGIITFYPEPIYLITNKREIRHIEQLSTFKVNLGPEKSGLLADVVIILKSLNIYDTIKPAHFKPTQILDLLKSDIIQASFVNNLNSEMLEAVENKNLFIIPLNLQHIQSLRRTYPYFDEFTTRIQGDYYSTVAVKAMLICKSTLDETVAFNLTKILYEYYGDLAIPDRDIFLVKQNVSNQMSLKSWHRGSFKYFNEIGVLKSQAALKYVWLLLFIPMILVWIFVLSNILFISIHKKFPFIFSANSSFLKFIKRFNLFFHKFRYLMIVLMMATLLLTNIYIVQKVEHNWAIKNNVISSFDNNTFSKNLVWLFVFGGSGYSDNIFPKSPLGKLLVTLIPLIGIGGLVSIVGLATSEHIKRKILEAKGVQIRMIKNHIILCGWNENAPFLIQNMLHDNISHKRPIVVLSDLNEEMPLEKFGIKDKMVSFIRGNATSKADLKRANLRDADIAIIISDSNTPDPDAKNILKIFTIEKYCRELEDSGLRKNRENIYTVAEIHDTDNFELAYDAYVDEIILLGHIQSKILVQSVLNPGVSKFVNEILTYNEYNDIYSIFIKPSSKLCGLTFDELLIKLRSYKILLLSICVNQSRKDEIEKFGIDRLVITNPINENEINYKVGENDRLIVLAQYEKIVDRAVKSIEKKKN